MPRVAKRMKAMRAKVPEQAAPMPLADAVALLKTFNTTKFDQTVEIVMRLGIDPKQADQLVRGSIVLPHGIGKTLRVVVFAKGDKIDEAKAAGADEVGGPELAEKIKGGWTEFDVCIAAPDMMGVVGPVGQGPGPSRADALAAGRHGHARRGQGHQGVQGGQGRIPLRRGRKRARRGRQDELRRRQAGGQHQRVHQFRPAPQAGGGQGQYVKGTVIKGTMSPALRIQAA